MRFIQILKPAMLLVMMVALTPMLMPATASAEPTTIYAELGACRQSADGYQVQLQSRNQRAPQSAFPEIVTLTFEDGSTGTATQMASASFGTQYYSLDENRGVAVTGATAIFDTDLYPNYRFTVINRPEPCFPEPEPVIYSVTGDIVQRGNEKPVSDLTVCLVEADVCTTTDASGFFAFSGVEDGTYTLTSDGSNWKPQSNTVTVAGADVYVGIVQQKGGGR